MKYFIALFLLLNGINIYGQNTKIIIDEDFSGKNKWSEGEDLNYKVGIENGKFVINSKTGGWYYWGHHIIFDERLDYSIEFSVKKVSGANHCFFGLALGQGKSSDFHFIGINGSGFVGMSSTDFSVFDVIPTKYVSFLNQDNQKNTIKLIKKGTEFLIYLNGKFAEKCKAQNFRGNFYGFLANGCGRGLKIEYDDFKIVQYLNKYDGTESTLQYDSVQLNRPQSTIPFPNADTVYEKRIALIIGNKEYSSVGQSLKNPVNDARLFAKTLSSLSFDTIVVLNANRIEIISALNRFYSLINSYDVSLIYYAGHGSSDKANENYLIPVDAKIKSVDDLSDQAYSVSKILRNYADYPTKIKFLVMDACRSLPLIPAFRGGDRGLNFDPAPIGTFISYATQEHSTALDGIAGDNGVFTEELCKQLMIPQSLENLFVETRKNVLIKTQNLQCPQESSNMISTFYFNKGTIKLNGSSKAKINFDSPKVNAPNYNDILRIRKELVSLGVKWEYNDFVKYLYEGDTLVSQLFLQCGMKLKKTDFVNYVQNNFRNSTSNLLLEYRGIEEEGCLTELNVNFYYLYNTLKDFPERAILFQNLCSKEKLTEINSLIENEKSKINRFEKKLKDYPSDSSCLRTFNNELKIPLRDLVYKYYDDASKFNIIGPLTYTKREEILAKLKTGTMTNDDFVFNNPLEYFKKAVFEICPEYYYFLEKDNYTLNLLLFAKQLISDNEVK